MLKDVELPEKKPLNRIFSSEAPAELMLGQKVGSAKAGSWRLLPRVCSHFGVLLCPQTLCPVAAWPSAWPGTADVLRRRESGCGYQASSHFFSAWKLFFMLPCWWLYAPLLPYRAHALFVCKQAACVAGIKHLRSL